MTCYLYDRNSHLVESNVSISIDPKNRIVLIGSTPHHMSDMVETESGYRHVDGGWYVIID